MPKLRKLNLRIPAVIKCLVSYQHTVSIKYGEDSTCTVPCSIKKSALLLSVVPNNHKPLPYHQATLTFNLVHSHNTLSIEIMLLNNHVSFLSTCLILWSYKTTLTLYARINNSFSNNSNWFLPALPFKKPIPAMGVYSQTSTCKTFIWSQLDIRDILGCNCISRTTAVSNVTSHPQKEKTCQQQHTFAKCKE
jgi:hypothetical protein